MKNLDDYFDAYDQTCALTTGAPGGKHLRKRIRRAHARPMLDLAWRIFLLAAFVTFGIYGHNIGYMLAAGSLCFIPQHIQKFRREMEAITQLSDDGELRQHLLKEANRRVANALVSAIFYAGIALLFLVTGAVAAALGKDFRPGVISGLIVAAFSTYHLLVSLPRASREGNALEKDLGSPDAE